MYSTANKIIILFVVTILAQKAYCQEKYESESRLNINSVPAQAIDFVDAMQISGKVKWYKEVGIETESIESKFKLDKKHYSVEFDTAGVIQDIEIIVKWSALETKVKNSIGAHFSKTCSKFEISKIQLQYSGSRSDLLSFVKKKDSSENLNKKYEMIVKCVNESNPELFEYLFDEEGEVLESTKIIFKNSSNLEY